MCPVYTGEGWGGGRDTNSKKRMPLPGLERGLFIVERVAAQPTRTRENRRRVRACGHTLRVAETGGYGLRPNRPYALLNPSPPHRVGIDWLVCGQRLMLGALTVGQAPPYPMLRQKPVAGVADTHAGKPAARVCLWHTLRIAETGGYGLRPNRPYVLLKRNPAFAGFLMRRRRLQNSYLKLALM